MDENIGQLIESQNEQIAQLYQEGRYQQAIEIAHQALGLTQQHPDEKLGRAAVLNNLAVLYEALGNYAAARPLMEQAVEIYRTTLSESDPDLATGLSNLGGVYMELGDFRKAESLYRQALQITHVTQGENDPNFAASVKDLALLYQYIGSYDRAEYLFQKAVEIFRKLGEENIDFARSLNDLAGLYETIGKYTDAEPLYKQALSIEQVVLGKNHPEIATILNNLAFLYESKGQYKDALPFYQEALAIRRTHLGENHPDVASTLNNIAELDRALGDDAAAMPLLERVLRTRRETLGDAHPNVSQSLNNLAALYITFGHFTQALPLLQEAQMIDSQVIGQIFTIGSESQRMVYLTLLLGRQYAFLSLVRLNPDNLPTLLPAGLDLVLQRKAVAAEALAIQRDIVLSGRYPSLESLLNKLRALQAQIALKTLAGPAELGQEGLRDQQQLLAEWTAQKEQLEVELARQIPEMYLHQQLCATDCQSVAKSLPDGAALVEFVRFDVYDFQAVPARGESLWKPAHYLAFILKADEPHKVEMVDLGEAELIDKMIVAFQIHVTGDERSLTKELEPTVLTSSPSDGAALRAAVFDPLRKALGGRIRLFLAPDGDLSQLPFEALPLALDGGQYLIDLYQISYLSTGRDLLRFTNAVNRSPGPPVVLADPDFDLDAEGFTAPTFEEQPISRQSRALDRSGLRFNRLKGARQEGEQVGIQLGVKPQLADTALESILKGLRSPRILHIATHGFFLPDQPRNSNVALSNQETTRDVRDKRGGRLFGQRLENPLLRSGLALAGANSWLQGKTLRPDAEDGLLTAEDATGLDLLDTELVVLSACDTGRGEVHVGEGVFGLRRAFVLAGAKTLVMSLWKVPDQATRELMVDFYQRLLKGAPRAEALRQAQLALKKKYPNPRFWGAFICQGDPGPLPEYPSLEG